MQCRIYFPSPIVRPFISHYQVIDFHALEPDMPCTMPAGTCALTIILNDLTPQFESETARFWCPGDCFLSGYFLKAVKTKLTGNYYCLMVIFTPLGAGRLFKIPQKEYLDQFVPLENIIGKPATLIITEQLRNSQNQYQLIHGIETIIIDLLADAAEKNIVCNNAISLILKEKGNIRIDTLTSRLNISSRQLDRSFEQHLGVSPKQYTRMTRLHNAYLMLMHHPEYSVFDILFQLGYYDQAHFIRDLKKYSNVTPQQIRTKISDSIISKYN